MIDQPIIVPKEAVDAIKASLHRSGVETLDSVLAALRDGVIDAEEASDLQADALEHIFDALERVADAIVVLSEPAETVSDQAIKAGLDLLEGMVDPFVDRMRSAVDEWLDARPLRLMRRLDEAVEEGRNRRVRRLAKKLSNKFPRAALGVGIRKIGEGPGAVYEVPGWEPGGVSR